MSKSEQSRLNGAKSQGPTSPEGRAKSSLNALKHGLFSNIIVLPGEDAAAYETLRADLFAEHKPATPQQIELVEHISAAHWRLRRLIDIESTLMYNHMTNLEDHIENHAQGHDPDLKRRHYIALAFEQMASTPAMEALSRHESRLSTQITRLLRALARLKALEQQKTAEIRPDQPETAPSPDEQTQSHQHVPQKRGNEPKTLHFSSVIPAESPLTLVPKPQNHPNPPSELYG